MNNLQFESIYCLGDTHSLEAIPHFVDMVPTDSLIISVGDVALGFDLHSEEQRILEGLDQELEWRGSKVFIIRGNHDAPNRWNNEFPNLKNIELIKDYTYKTINNKVFLFVGGAVSVDRWDRKEEIDWWRNEGVEFLPDEQLNKLPNCDVLITHSAPDFCYPVGYDAPIVIDWARHDKTLIQDLQRERQYLTKLVEQVKPKYHAYGHFHSNNSEIINNCKHILLDIGELREIKL